MIKKRIKKKPRTEAQRDNYKVFYWREGNNEVDFVLEKDGSLVALEVKSGHKTLNKGMSVFKQKYPHSKLLLVSAMQVPSGAISIVDFLQMQVKDLF